MTSIAIVCKPLKEELTRLLPELVAWLRQRGYEPLLDEEGNVIGVNSQIASDAAQTEGSQPGSTGVGFAISSNTVAAICEKPWTANAVSSPDFDPK